MSLATAIEYLKKGEWQSAHPLVQEDESKLGCWGHAIVHLYEGDVANARYWFRRAGRPFPARPDPAAEVALLAAEHEAARS